MARYRSPNAPHPSKSRVIRVPHRPHTRFASGGHTALDFDVLYADLLHWEGKVPWMYLDTQGLVTVGVGLLLKSVEDAQRLPFVNSRTGLRATPLEVGLAFNAVARMAKAHAPRHYRLDPSLELPEEAIKAFALHKLEYVFLPAIARYFPGFETFPAPAQRALLDLAYNGGPRGTANLTLADSVRQHRWHEAARRVPARGNPRRTAWRRRMFRAAAIVEPQAHDVH